MITLQSINMVSGLNSDGQGFITITAVGDDRTMMLGQMTPDEMRDHGFACLAAAEGAETDAAVYAVTRELFPDGGEMADTLAGVIITKLREMRNL